MIRHFLNKTWIVFCSLGLLCAGCRTGPQSSDWEYQDTFLAPGESLNQMAKDGWIVVGAYYDADNKSAHFIQSGSRAKCLGGNRLDRVSRSRLVWPQQNTQWAAQFDCRAPRRKPLDLAMKIIWACLMLIGYTTLFRH